MITIHNDGPAIVGSNYWESDQARQGLLFLSTNAGAFRLLLPPVMDGQIPEMMTGRYVAVTRGRYRGRDSVEIMFDDCSDSPYSIHLDILQCDRVPAPEDVGREDLVLTLWTSGPRLRASFRAVYRLAARLPYLKPHQFRQPS